MKGIKDIVARSVEFLNHKRSPAYVSLWLSAYTLLAFHYPFFSYVAENVSDDWSGAWIVCSMFILMLTLNYLVNYLFIYIGFSTRFGPFRVVSSLFGGRQREISTYGLHFVARRRGQDATLRRWPTPPTIVRSASLEGGRQKNHRPEKLTGGPQLHFSNKMSKLPRMNAFDSRIQRYDIFWHFKIKRVKKLHFDLFSGAKPLLRPVFYQPSTPSSEPLCRVAATARRRFLHFFCRFFWRYKIFAYLCNRKTMVP